MGRGELRDLGIVGDGDDKDLTNALEQAFAVEFAEDAFLDAITAGDVYTIIQREIASQESSAVLTWEGFTNVLHTKADVRRGQIVPHTQILAAPVSVALKRLIRGLAFRK
ncbi:hypothetical protein [Parvularcula maris]|uniref:Uncharacterized protein n=1 Tax=Parvularcula maris TaxID=2965077 RepID=A0A9X2L9B3_9PROT|nr:hypothetical protein [Parvularcula maris]MCQ8185412.1 hypothetical protein [Parvularcula maris]